ncbi:hypothetical protein ABZX62_33015 [Streptomyces flavidovirens]|uniref:hypothetical protein n=1 Tax=Streptomyces flavidovirens TaxID=67298 RepID=UPI0033B6AD10
MAEDGVGIVAIRCRCASVQQFFTRPDDALAAALGAVVINLLRPGHEPPPHENQQLRPVTVGAVIRLAGLVHGIAAGPQLASQCPYATHEPTVIWREVRQVNTSQRVMGDLDGTGERSAVEIHQVAAVEAASSLECLLELVADGVGAEQVGASP